MSQIDLSPLFTPPSKERAPRSEPLLSQGWKDPRAYPSAERPSGVKITWSQLTNIGFVLASCLGALVSVLYLIRGSDLFQDVSAWPRELFYGRPAPSPAASVIAPLTTSSKDESGDPFSPTSRLLTLNPPIWTGNQPNSPSSSTPFASAPFNRLGMPAPGGDALSRSLTESVPASAQSDVSAASATGQTVTSRIQQATTATAKAITGQSKVATARVRSSRVKLKSKTAHGWARHRSSRAGGAGRTASTGGITVAEPGSHIGALSQPIGSSTGALRSTATRATGRAGAVRAMNPIHGVGRLGGR